LSIQYICDHSNHEHKILLLSCIFETCGTHTHTVQVYTTVECRLFFLYLAPRFLLTHSLIILTHSMRTQPIPSQTFFFISKYTFKLSFLFCIYLKVISIIFNVTLLYKQYTIKVLIGTGNDKRTIKIEMIFFVIAQQSTQFAILL
jgi:hypothetical protein